MLLYLQKMNSFHFEEKENLHDNNSFLADIPLWTTSEWWKYIESSVYIYGTPYKISFRKCGKVVSIIARL